MTWRDGVHLTGTPIWCDARRRRDVCFVSSADRVGRAGHGQLIGTPVTLALLGAAQVGHLAVPPLRPFTLGTLRLELIPSGRALGAAALFVDLGARSVLYAGEIRTSGADAAQVRACDAVVVAAPVATALPKVDEVERELLAWLRARLDANQKPMLVVDTASDGLELAARLTAADLGVAGSRSLRDAALRIGSLAPVAALKGKDVAIRVDADRGKHDGPVALVSPRAATGFDATFAWPFVADRDQLLAWIEQTRAKEVFVTGAAAEPIAQALGSRARVLGPPHQMTLFPREASQ